MRHDTDPAEIARRVADATLVGVAEARAFVIISLIDLVDYWCIESPNE